MRGFALLILLVSGCASAPAVCRPHTVGYRGAAVAAAQTGGVAAERPPEQAVPLSQAAPPPVEQTTQRPAEPMADPFGDAPPDDGPIFLPPLEPSPPTDASRLPPAFHEPVGDMGTVYPGAWDPIVTTPDHGSCCETFRAYGRDMVHRIGADYVHYYSADNLLKLGVGVGVAAILANTAMDQNFRNFYQSKIRNENTDEYCEALHVPRFMGDGLLTIPILVGATLAGPVFPDSPLAQAAGHWGQRSLRAMLVGWPPLLALQYITGASRPCESPHNSHWNPFQDNNGVSGHAFMGAIPPLTAAMMARRPIFKFAFAFVSTFAGISRINDDRHYLSQVLLGWWMAYLAVQCVDETEHAATSIQIVPTVADGGIGATAMIRW